MTEQQDEKPDWVRHAEAMTAEHAVTELKRDLGVARYQLSVAVAELERIRAGIERTINMWEPHGNPATFIAVDLRALLSSEGEQQ